MDYLEICEDEVALEGLDGITLPTLWLRLSSPRLKKNLELTEFMKNYFWRFVVQNSEFSFYKLPKDRPEPQIFERYKENTDYKSVFLASCPDELDQYQEVYSSKPVAEDGLKGACLTFLTRVDVTEEIRTHDWSWKQCSEKYGERQLVIVASQSLRVRALNHGNLIPELILKLDNITYCVLEHIARSRWQGELQSVLNKQVFIEKSYHIHYVMTKLYKLGLVTKRPYSYRREDKNNKIYFQILVHTTRFQGDGKTRMDTMMDIAQETLEKVPNCMMNLADLRQKLGMGQKNFKSLFQRMVKSGVATIQVKDPLKKVPNISNKIITLVTKSNSIEEEFDDEEIVDQEPNGDEPSCSMVVEQPLVHQSFAYVLERGSKGVSQKELLSFLKGYGKLESRNICRIFEKWGLIKTIMVDHGRQRFQRHIPLVFAKLNPNSRQFTEEKRKMKELLSESTLAPAEESSSVAMPSIVCSNNNDTILSIAKDVSVETGLFTSSSEPQPTVPLTSTQSHTTITTESYDSETTSTQENSMEDDCDISLPKISTMSNEILLNSYGESSTQKRKWDSVLTTRKMKRHNLILAALQDKKIVESFITLQKIITQSEEKEGIKSKIDRKTVRRLVYKMHDDGFLRHSIIPIYCNEQKQNFHFIMSLDCDQQHLQSAIDHAKFKLLGEEEKIAARNSSPKLLKNPKQQKHTVSSHLTEGPEENLKIEELPREKQLPYGFQPKFNRLRIIHQLVWYLAYGHPHSATNVSDSDCLNRQGSDVIDLDKVKVYLDEMTWKRFLPPVPLYKRNGSPCLQVGDIAVILPIFVLCQFHRFTYEIENLEEWLEHEQKRFALVRHLPASTRALLFYKRKYLYSFVSCLEQLAFMGLVTLRKVISGTNCLAKENLMFYVNRNTTVLDTRSSGKSYLYIDDKTYTRIKFTFNSYSDVDAYWPKLKDICLRTRLGYKNYKTFTETSYNGHRGGVFLKKFVAKHLDEKNDPQDIGDVPGDRKGAGGLDSSMYAHLYRNWIMYPHLTTKPAYATVSDEENAHESTKTNQVPSARRLPKLAEKNLVLTPAKKKKPSEESTKIFAKPPVEREVGARKRHREPSKDLSGKKKKRSSGHSENKTSPFDLTNQNKCVPKISSDFSVVSVSNVGRNDKVRGGRGVKRKQVAIQPKPVVKKIKILTTNEKAKMTKIGKHKIKYVDKRDLLALSNRRGRVRVTFTSAEDALLLLCRVASTILLKKYKMKGRNAKRNLVPWSVVRDLMQANITESSDKTSYAVGRRTLFIMKNQETQICHDICVVDACSDKTIIAEILNKHSPDQSHIDLKHITETYHELVNALRERFRVHPGMILESIPDTLHCLNASYTINIITPSSCSRKRRVIPDSICEETIMKSAIENLIYVSLSIQDDEFSIYQSYKSFEVYPESLVVTVFNQMKASGIVSNKLEVLRKKSTWLPFAVPSYHLSHLHASTFKTLIPQEVMPEFNKSMKELEETRRVVMDIDVSLGHVLIMVYLQLKNCIDIEINVPDNIIFPDVPETSLFENQFLAQMKEAQTELANRLTKENQDHPEKKQTMSKLFPMSILNAASALIKESSNSKQKENGSLASPDRSRLELEDEDDVDAAQFSDGDSKLAAIIKLYQRHPSYTNWLLLNNTENKDDSKVLNYSLNSENVVLTPCRVTMLPSEEFNTKIKPEIVPSGDVMKSLESRKWKSVKVEKTLDDLSAAELQILKILEEGTSSGITENEIICHHVEGHNLLFSHSNLRQGVAFPALQKLIENELIFPVGFQERRYVHHDHAKIWMTKGFRFCGVKSKFQAEISHELHLLKSSKNMENKKPQAKDCQTATMNEVDNEKGSGSSQMENKTHPVLDSEPIVIDDDDEISPEGTSILQKEDKKKSDPDSEPIVINDCEAEKQQGSLQSELKAMISGIVPEAPKTTSSKKLSYDFDSMQNKERAKSSFKNLYEEVDFLCRPWHTLGGEINYKNAKMMLCSVFLKIMVSPGISYQSLYSIYETILQPISLTELLDVLCEVGCIVRFTFRKPEPLSLFGSCAQCQTQTYYEASEDGLVRISRIFIAMDEKIRPQFNTTK